MLHLRASSTFQLGRHRSRPTGNAGSSPHGPAPRVTCTRRGARHRESTAKINALQGGNDFEAAPAGISVEQAYEILGISSKVSFEDILAVKNKLIQANAADPEKKLEIEAAYDVLFMQSMRRRVSGDVAVPGSVRYADVPKASPSPQAAAANAVLKRLPTVSVRAPSKAEATTQAAVFGTLATWALLQALLEPQDAAAADVAGWQLALAAGFSVYALKDNKKMSLGRALGLTSAALIAGVLVGALLENYLRVDIVPLGGFSSPGVLVAEFAIVAVWAACAFLV